VQIPWFIGLFVLASVIRSIVPGGSDIYSVIGIVAKALLSLTLFLIGAGLSRSAIKKVGARPLIAGVSLWILVAVTTVGVILSFQ
jgi:uncharacterized membrane protein YadS